MCRESVYGQAKPLQVSYRYESKSLARLRHNPRKKDARVSHFLPYARVIRLPLAGGYQQRTDSKTAHTAIRSPADIDPAEACELFTAVDGATSRISTPQSPSSEV